MIGTKVKKQIQNVVKQQKENKVKSQKGITLLALVITIIVLLILAGITIMYRKLLMVSQ